MLSGVLHPYFAHKIDAVEKPQTIQIYNITTKGEFQEKNKEKVENKKVTKTAKIVKKYLL
jgi:hypothetical protein